MSRWRVALLVLLAVGCVGVVTPDDVVGRWDLVEFDAPGLPAEREPTVEFWELRADGWVTVASAVNDGDGRWSLRGGEIRFSDVKISAVGSTDPVVTAGENALLTLIFVDSVDVRLLADDRKEISSQGAVAVLQRKP